MTLVNLFVMIAVLVAFIAIMLWLAKKIAEDN
jgi:hypothetical protein